MENYDNTGISQGEKEYNELLKARIAEAEKNGKEPFSAEEFDKHYARFDLSDSATKIAGDPERIRMNMCGYYVAHPEVMTVKEYAEKLMDTEAWGGN